MFAFVAIFTEWYHRDTIGVILEVVQKRLHQKRALSINETFFWTRFFRLFGDFCDFLVLDIGSHLPGSGSGGELPAGPI